MNAHYLLFAVALGLALRTHATRMLRSRVTPEVEIVGPRDTPTEAP
jgi:hypothetical protein